GLMPHPTGSKRAQKVDDIDLSIREIPGEPTLQRMPLPMTQARNARWASPRGTRQERGAPAVRVTTGQQLVGDARETVHIVARIRIEAMHALRARISGRADRHVALLVVQIAAFCRARTSEAELEHTHFAGQIGRA